MFSRRKKSKGKILIRSIAFIFKWKLKTITNVTCRFSAEKEGLHRNIDPSNLVVCRMLGLKSFKNFLTPTLHLYHIEYAVETSTGLIQQGDKSVDSLLPMWKSNFKALYNINSTAPFQWFETTIVFKIQKRPFKHGNNMI